MISKIGTFFKWIPLIKIESVAQITNINILDVAQNTCFSYFGTDYNIGMHLNVSIGGGNYNLVLKSLQNTISRTKWSISVLL